MRGQGICAEHLLANLAGSIGLNVHGVFQNGWRIRRERLDADVTEVGVNRSVMWQLHELASAVDGRARGSVVRAGLGRKTEETHHRSNRANPKEDSERRRFAIAKMWEKPA